MAGYVSNRPSGTTIDSELDKAVISFNRTTNIDNTSDINKPVSTAQATAITESTAGIENVLSPDILIAKNMATTANDNAVLATATANTANDTINTHANNSAIHLSIKQSDDIAYLDGVTSNIQNQINAIEVGGGRDFSLDPINLVSEVVGVLPDANIDILLARKSDMDDKQPILVSGINIKTINNEDILGTGNIITNMQFQTKIDLPPIGSSSTNYTIIDENAIYNWVIDKYICVGRDYTEISIINGGNANG